jgi:hypothetical protein
MRVAIVFVFMLIVSAIIPLQRAEAEKICIRATIKSGKVIQSVRTVLSNAKCPRGFAQVVDTAVLKGPQGDVGPTGPTGPTGATGAAGAPGEFAATVPSAITLTGTFGTYGLNDGSYYVSTHSFAAALSAAPTANLRPVGSNPNVSCPGTVAAPAAAPGHLCLYEGIGSNRTGANIFNPLTSAAGASKFGFGYAFVASNVGGPFAISHGSWAVTAP